MERDAVVGRSRRKSRGGEPGRLSMFGTLIGWDSKWQVGWVRGDDGREHPIGREAFGPQGLAKAARGGRLAFSLAPGAASGHPVSVAKPVIE